MTTAQPDPTFEQLALRNADLEAEKATLSAENDRLRASITRARLYAGEHLPAAAGTGIVHLLEQALREAS